MQRPGQIFAVEVDLEEAVLASHSPNHRTRVQKFLFVVDLPQKFSLKEELVVGFWLICYRC